MNDPSAITNEFAKVKLPTKCVMPGIAVIALPHRAPDHSGPMR